MYPKFTQKWLVEKYSTKEAQKEALKKVNNTILNWKKVHSKKEMKALSNDVVNT